MASMFPFTDLFAQDQFKGSGNVVASSYAVTMQNGHLHFSSDIFDEYGKPQKANGPMWMEGSRAASNGQLVSSTSKNGFVWTPRVLNIGKLDLTTHGKLTDLKEFNSKIFHSHPIA